MINNNTLADMHIHSNASDSDRTPEQIIKDLVDKNIRICSLTDHNCIINQNEFISLARDNGLHPISGVEISSKVGIMVYHILAYNFDPNNPVVHSFVDPILKMMIANNRELIHRMSDDYKEISLAEYDNYSYNKNRGGWKSVQYIFDKGLSESLVDGLKYNRQYDTPLSNCPYPSPKEVIDEIHSWGATAILAHPSSYFRGDEPTKTDLFCLFNEMKSFGIDGLECHYRGNSEFMTHTCIEWCKNNNMLITVGCDCHGSFVPGREIGSIRVPLPQLNIKSLINE